MHMIPDGHLRSLGRCGHIGERYPASGYQRCNCDAAQLRAGNPTVRGVCTLAGPLTSQSVPMPSALVWRYA